MFCVISEPLATGECDTFEACAVKLASLFVAKLFEPLNQCAHLIAVNSTILEIVFTKHNHREGPQNSRLGPLTAELTAKPEITIFGVLVPA